MVAWSIPTCGGSLLNAVQRVWGTRRGREGHEDGEQLGDPGASVREVRGGARHRDYGVDGEASSERLPVRGAAAGGWKRRFRTLHVLLYDASRVSQFRASGLHALLRYVRAESSRATSEDPRQLASLGATLRAARADATRRRIDLARASRAATPGGRNRTIRARGIHSRQDQGTRVMVDLSLLPDGGARWLDASGEHADIVLSTRIRLARNVEGYAFTGRARDGERLRILTQVRDALPHVPSLANGVLLRVDELPPTDRLLL